MSDMTDWNRHEKEAAAKNDAPAQVDAMHQRLSQQEKRQEGREEKQTFASGTTSIKGHRLDMLPINGLCCAADRFEYGDIKHKETSYQTKGTAALDDKEWLINRMSHVIQHAYDAIKLIRTGAIVEAYAEAGAISFGGLVLGEAVVHWREKLTKRVRDLDANPNITGPGEYLDLPNPEYPRIDRK